MPPRVPLAYAYNIFLRYRYCLTISTYHIIYTKKQTNKMFYTEYAFTRRRDRHAALRTRPRFNQLAHIRVIQSEPRRQGYARSPHPYVQRWFKTTSPLLLPPKHPLFTLLL